MSFPLYIILIIYFIFLLFYFIYSFVLLYHIFRFGYWDSSTRFMLFLYFTGVLVILVASGIYLIGIDWSETVSIFNDIEFNISIF